MNKLVYGVIATLALTATSLFAADLTGKWAAEVTNRNGEKRTQVFNLKADGEALTGTVTGMGGQEMKIEEGKVAGDDVSFSVTMEFNGNTRKVEYKGKVVGDQINFKTGQGDRVREFSAKRATS
ncbi:MAG TPA: hypothetical protein VEX68_30270 [Bryobacteraceae bacterium]|nr:hypothetical protein [Bryobacteraceae bacterium]